VYVARTLKLLEARFWFRRRLGQLETYCMIALIFHARSVDQRSSFNFRLINAQHAPLRHINASQETLPLYFH
jgi:hypothetical protein